LLVTGQVFFHFTAAMAPKQPRSGIRNADKDATKSLYDASLRHFQAGRFTVAEERVRRALASNPQHADSLYLAGLIQTQANKIDLAIDFFVQAIRINQGNPEYFSSLGTCLARQDRLLEAHKSYEVALKLKPDYAEVWVKIGDLARQQGRTQEALLAYDHALSLNPGLVDAADKSGSLLVELKRYDEALARFEQSDAIRPGRSETLFSKGLCFQALKRSQEAATSYIMALAADGANYIARNNLGVTLLETGQLEEAAAQFLKVTRIRPHEGNAFNNLGLALSRLKRFDDALNALDRAVALAPGHVEAINNRGNVLRQMNRTEEALADFDRAIALNPNYAYAHANRAACLDDLSRPEEALASYQVALALKPDHSDTHWNLAINRLRVGDFKNGWIEAEWRWKVPWLRLSRTHSTSPLWLGAEPIADKTLLVHNDQGLGDAIQFCRYIPLLVERGARVILEIDAPLRELLSGVAGIAQCLVKGETLPDHDFHCPLTSLPLAFNTTIDTIPSAVPYISVRERDERWEEFLGSARLPRIGIVWSGNPNNTKDQNRSMPLKTLLPLFDIEAQFVSLQKDVRESDLAIFRKCKGIFDAAPEIENFADTASLIKHLDLMITVDTSVAHLAGALGKPVWILLAYASDYRWLLDRDDCPWYPTARLFRQTSTKDYADVVDRVRGDLGEWVAGRRGHWKRSQ
jgi:tetratricopeptide (TPR) repeat protein